MTKNDALEMALDVLKAAHIALPKSMFIEDAITAIKEALAQPAQEPEAQAWDEGYRAGIDDERTSEANIGIAGMGMKVEPARNNPYYATPLAAQPAQEPVEWLTGCPECGMDSGCDCDSGTCNPPQRLSLTRDEILFMARRAGVRSAAILHMFNGNENALNAYELEDLERLEHFAALVDEAATAAANAKLKEKNT